MYCNGERPSWIYTQPKGRGNPPMYDNNQNHCNLALWDQENIGWDKLVKVWISGQWIEYVKQHTQNENIKLRVKEWAPTMILALWDHIL
jgi:hypothetical protein